MKSILTIIPLIVLMISTASAETFTFTIPDPYLDNSMDQPVLLSVTGTGNVKAMPDQVVISADIYTQDKKAGKAYDENQRKMRTLMDKLRVVGLEKKNIATESMQIETVYKNDSGKVDYFYVYRSIKIFQEDMDSISPILDALIESEIEDIGSINFVVSNLDEKYRDALESAAKDCNETAAMLASAMGARIVGLKDVNYNMGGYNYYNVGDTRDGWGIESGEMLGGADNQMIVPREVTTTVNVNAIYEIEYTGL